MNRKKRNKWKMDMVNEHRLGLYYISTISLPVDMSKNGAFDYVEAIKLLKGMFGIDAYENRRMLLPVTNRYGELIGLDFILSTVYAPGIEKLARRLNAKGGIK